LPAQSPPNHASTHQELDLTPYRRSIIPAVGFSKKKNPAVGIHRSSKGKDELPETEVTGLWQLDPASQCHQTEIRPGTEPPRVDAKRRHKREASNQPHRIGRLAAVYHLQASGMHAHPDQATHRPLAPSHP
jgi:hypothetical protein